MTYVSFIEKIVKDLSFQTRDEKDALWDWAILL